MLTMRLSVTEITIAAFLMLSSPVPVLAFQAPPMILKPLQTGVAACYSQRSVGHRTSSGQKYDPNALTAAHGTLPLGAHVRVTNLENGKSVVVLVNDRMSAHGKIVMDVSERACRELKFGPSGQARVKLEVEPAPSRATLSQ